jgi:uncharacterized membrane protein
VEIFQRILPVLKKLLKPKVRIAAQKKELIPKKKTIMVAVINVDILPAVVLQFAVEESFY